MNLIRLLFHRHKWVALYSEIYSPGIKRVCHSHDNCSIGIMRVYHSHDKCFKCGDVRLALRQKAFRGQL